MAVYACSDIHGYYQIYEKIKSILKPDDRVYFLGDANDRGPDSWKCIKAIYDDPQFIYIKGNHEDMLVKACEEYLDDGYQWEYYSWALSARNGGRDTMESWEQAPDRVAWVKRLRDLPTWDTYCANGREIVLCHAGFTPWMEPGDTSYIVREDEKLIWDREHYYTHGYLPAYMDDVLVVHGHTPIHHLSADIDEPWESGAFWYMNNHKCCIDSGGFFSGEFVLLNLDTLEDIVLTLD